MARRRRAEQAAQPHDGLVRWAFSQREHAIGLLKAALPPELVAAVDFGTLVVVKDSFVDPSLRRSHSDLILEARMGGERIYFYFYTVVEHQRNVEPLMVFRMLEYMVSLWQRALADRPATRELPPIVPLLLHHSETGWTAATAFQDIVGGGGHRAGASSGSSSARAAIARHIPHFELRLIDLSEGRASRLVEEALTALGRLVVWCLSVAGDDARLEREIDRMGEVLDEVIRAPNGVAALGALMRYLAATHVRMQKQKLSGLLQRAVSPAAKEVIVTFLDEIRLEGKREGKIEGKREGKREGKLEGKREGKLEGKREVLSRLLAARFGPLPEDVRAQIQSAGDATLEKWTLRVLTAPTLEAVLDSGTAKAAPARRSSSRPSPRKRTRRPASGSSPKGAG